MTMIADITPIVEQAVVEQVEALDRETRNALVLRYLEEIKPVLINLANNTILEYDDLYQDASLIIMRALELRPAQAYELKFYIISAVCNRSRNAVYRLHRWLNYDSLDQPPAGSDVTLPLYELLPYSGERQQDPLELLAFLDECREYETRMMRHPSGEKRRPNERAKISEFIDDVVADYRATYLGEEPCPLPINQLKKPVNLISIRRVS